MVRILAGIVIVLHGLVHLWYFALARGLVQFKTEMGWSGKSWLFTNFIGDAGTRNLASVVLLLPTVGLSVGGIGFLVEQPWARPVLIASAAVSALALILFWDRSMQLIVQKGLIGIVIDVAILAGLLLV
jgi:hypothetical protein